MGHVMGHGPWDGVKSGSLWTLASGAGPGGLGGCIRAYNIRAYCMRHYRDSGHLKPADPWWPVMLCRVQSAECRV